MLSKILSVRVQAWILVLIVLVASVFLFALRTTSLMSPTLLLYVVQPILAVGIAAATYGFTRGQPDRIHHKADRAFAVGSIMAVWSVVYILSGLAVTYTRNALVASFVGVLLNLLTYSIVAIGFEYARHGAMLLAGRRNIVWFGVIVMVVFTMQQVTLAGLLNAQSVSQAVQAIASDIIPAIASSAVLTYLAATSGFVSQLVYRIGLVLLVVLPPIIPNHDWHMVGMSSVLLAIVTFVVLDKRRPESDSHKLRRYQRHTRPALNSIFVFLMIALMCFMTGLFSYKPVVIMSDSMVPIFARGSIVVVQQRYDPLDIQVGDIIQYSADTIMITHRVVAIEVGDESKRIFITKGDNNSSYDSPVKDNQIVGVVRSTVPYLGYPTVWLQELSR